MVGRRLGDSVHMAGFTVCFYLVPPQPHFFPFFRIHRSVPAIVIEQFNSFDYVYMQLFSQKHHSILSESHFKVKFMLSRCILIDNE